MNSKQRIIVSITGIFIVLIALLGLTYAYFLTRIKENENEKSIYVTTANLMLEYGNDDGSIIGENETITPGTTFDAKTFTVKNTGNAAVNNYAVILENVETKYAETVVDSEGNILEEKDKPVSFRTPEDFELTIECEITESEYESKIGTACTGIANSTLPLQDSEILDENGNPTETYIVNGILITSRIEKGETHTYTATLTYKDNGNQTADMNKVLAGKFNIIDANNTLDIEGKVTGYTDGDIVETNSVPRRSQINSDGTYKIVGLESDVHRVKIVNKETETEISKISIVKSKTASVGETTIDNKTVPLYNITDASRKGTLNINLETNKVEAGEGMEDYNPFNEGTLVHNIYKNALFETNGTELVLDGSAESRVGNRISRVTNGKTNPNIYTLSRTNAKNYYIAYACDYTLNKYGEISLGTEECPVKITETKYTNTSEMINELKGKFAIWKTTSSIDTENVWPLNKISDNDTDFKSSSFKYITVNTLVSDEKVLSATSDDYGTSYYFRGGVEDNYVDFANMCWRIVRIAGDGSVKLILEDQDNDCKNSIGNWVIPASQSSPSTQRGYFGYSLNSNSKFVPNYLNSDNTAEIYEKSLGYALKNFQTENLENYINDLKIGDWCISDKTYSEKDADLKTSVALTDQEKSEFEINNIRYYYDSYVRLVGRKIKQPTLKCNGTVMDKWGDNETAMYVGALTGDEITYAGGKFNDGTAEYYLTNDYQRSKSLSYWTLTPIRFSDAGVWAFIDNQGYLYEEYVNWNASFRPAINLKTNIQVSEGTGTKNNSYKIISN